MTERVWTCTRISAGVRCGHRNPRRKQLCEACGKRRPATRRPDHMAALDLTYEQYIERTGGEFCALCGAEPKPGRRLHRDHDHAAGGSPRALLCFRCNTALPSRVSPQWLRAAADYLERFA